jgi:hypothetical protein
VSRRREPSSPVRRDKPGRDRRGSPRVDRGARVRVASALVILSVWGATTIADILSATYNPPDGVNTVALAAATYLFGSAFLKENNK